MLARRRECSGGRERRSRGFHQCLVVRRGGDGGGGGGVGIGDLLVVDAAELHFKLFEEVETPVDVRIASCLEEAAELGAGLPMPRGAVQPEGQMLIALLARANSGALPEKAQRQPHMVTTSTTLGTFALFVREREPPQMLDEDVGDCGVAAEGEEVKGVQLNPEVIIVASIRIFLLLFSHHRQQRRRRRKDGKHLQHVASAVLPL